ncbi:kinase domain-containing protein [Branchiostoma belcheri]|nr:kinase domain-containing protein [Branchiostoma belcheri]
MQPDVLVTGKHGVLRPRLLWIYLLCGLLACVGPRPALGHTTEVPPTEGPTETNCETPCPDKCLCSAVPKACTVDCSGQGLRQVPSPAGLPIPTKKLESLWEGCPGLAPPGGQEWLESNRYKSGMFPPLSADEGVLLTACCFLP